MSKPIIKLRVYKKIENMSGVVKNEIGEVQNENQLVSLKHNSLEWANYMKHVSPIIYAKIEVEKHFESENAKEASECPQSIKEEIENALKAPKKELTPEQQRIADLEAKLEAILSAKEEKAEAKTEPKAIDSELEEARDRYKKEIGKKPHHSWSIEKINEVILESKEA